MGNRLRPIYSLHEDDFDLEDEIDRFVIGLAESVDALQDAESAGDHDLLDDLATRMASQAAQLGYPDLEKIAKRVRTACEDADKVAIEESLVELTVVARRVRLGHRGAT